MIIQTAKKIINDINAISEKCMDIAGIKTAIVLNRSKVKKRFIQEKYIEAIKAVFLNV